MTLTTRTLINVDGQKVWASREQAETILTLIETRKGGFARVYGYTATSNRTVPSVYDATVTTRFSYAKLMQRQRDFIENVKVDDILDQIAADEKLLAAYANRDSFMEQFNARKAAMLASFDKTEQGDRSDAHRQAHDRCYLHIEQGIVVHYDTSKGDDGLMHPNLVDGFPVVASIMLNVLEVSRNVREAGVYKTVNSGIPVRISNAIERAMKLAGIRSLTRLSLKEDNFERLAIDGEVILPEDVVTLAA